MKMKKIIIIAILFLLPFIVKAQTSPPAYYNPFDSTLNITQLISSNVTYKKDAPIFQLRRLPGRGDSVFARQGGAWVFQFKDSLGGGGSSGWNINGNTGLNYGDYIGTNDNRSFWWKTNNTYRGVFDSLGRVGIGLPFGQRPLSKMDLWSTNGADTLLRGWNNAGTTTPFMFEANGDWWGNNYNVWRGLTATFTGEIANINTRVVTPAINVPSGGASIIMNGGGLTAGVGIGGAADAKALLDLQSTTKGFLPPRLTTTQQNAIASPPEGLLIWNTTLVDFMKYNGSAWVTVGGGGSTAPDGNFGNIQLNRNGLFKTPASDSLNFSAGLAIKGTLSATSLPSGAVTDSILVATGGTGQIKKVNVNVIAPLDTTHIVTGPSGFSQLAYSPRSTFMYIKALKTSFNGVAAGVTSTDSTLLLDFGTWSQTGTWTPTLTNTTNVAASTAYQWKYSRVVGTEDIYNFSGEVDIDPTTTLSLTVLTFTLPLTSNTTNTYDLSGTAADDLGTACRVAGLAGGTSGQVRFTPVDVTNRRFSVHGQFRYIAP